MNKKINIIIAVIVILLVFLIFIKVKNNENDENIYVIKSPGNILEVNGVRL